MAQDRDKDQPTSRRGFLKMAGVSAPAAIAVVAASGTRAQAGADDQAKTGVQDTPHTRAYFDSARF